MKQRFSFRRYIEMLIKDEKNGGLSRSALINNHRVEILPAGKGLIKQADSSRKRTSELYSVNASRGPPLYGGALFVLFYLISNPYIMPIANVAVVVATTIGFFVVMGGVAGIDDARRAASKGIASTAAFNLYITREMKGDDSRCLRKVSKE